MLELLQHPTLELLCTLEGTELCTRLGDEEQLRRPTPELTYALGELCALLVMRSSCGAPHRS